jgi:hypothetical protein
MPRSTKKVIRWQICIKSWLCFNRQPIDRILRENYFLYKANRFSLKDKTANSDVINQMQHNQKKKNVFAKEIREEKKGDENL